MFHPSDARATSFNSIPPEPLQWLWQNHIPRGKLSLLAGDPGSGKTSLILDLAARLSRNHRLPPFPPTPLVPQCPSASVPDQDTLLSTKDQGLSTLLLSPEDNLADTLRPRLEALGADINHIHTLPNFHSLVEPLQINGDSIPPLQHLDWVIQNIPNRALLVIDPITYFLGLTDRLLPNRPDSAPSPRSILHNLARLAYLNNIAILLTTRLTKKCPDANPASLRRALGSLAFAAAARTVHILIPNSDLAADTGHTLFAPLKNNLAELPPALSFFPAAGPGARPEWDPDPIFLIDPDKPAPRKQPPEDSSLGEAVQFLRLALADGPVRATDLQDQANENLVSLRTLRRAKEFLDCDARFDYSWKAWFWYLKGDKRPILTHFQQLDKEMATSLGSLLPNLQPAKKPRLRKESDDN